MWATPAKGRTRSAPIEGVARSVAALDRDRKRLDHHPAAAARAGPVSAGRRDGHEPAEKATGKIRIVGSNERRCQRARVDRRGLRWAGVQPLRISKIGIVQGKRTLGWSLRRGPRCGRINHRPMRQAIGSPTQISYRLVVGRFLYRGRGRTKISRAVVKRAVTARRSNPIGWNERRHRHIQGEWHRRLGIDRVRQRRFEARADGQIVPGNSFPGPRKPPRCSAPPASELLF